MADARIDITVLPDALFASIATYVARPSQAAFAVAVEGMPGPRRAVLASPEEWSTLDFGEVEASLASKLSDHDFHRMLTIIDAVNNLKVLKLTRCTAITGSGLAPLAGSSALEVIDLVAGRNHSLSSDVVVPIISSIVEQWVGLELPTPRRSWKLHAGERCLDLPASFCNGSRYFPMPTSKVREDLPISSMSSFVLYATAVRAGIKESNPNAGFREVAEIASRQYKALPAEERAYWDQQEAKDKERYEKEMQEYRKREEADRDGNVERFFERYAANLREAARPNCSMGHLPTLSFVLYGAAVRSDIKEANPNAGVREVARIIARQYKALPAEERADWDQKAVDEKERFGQELEEYEERKRLKLCREGELLLDESDDEIDNGSDEDSEGNWADY